MPLSSPTPTQSVPPSSLRKPERVNVAELMQMFSDLSEAQVRHKLRNVCGCYPASECPELKDGKDYEYILSKDYALLQV